MLEVGFLFCYGLDYVLLIELFYWDEVIFLVCIAGSALRRIGHIQWLRNIAVALGNGPADTLVIAALTTHVHHPSALVREHVAWALHRLTHHPKHPHATTLR